MFYNILLVILVLDAVLLIVAILLQAGKGGGLAASFGGASSSPDAFVGIRQAGTILTKATWWCGGIFLALSLLLSLVPRGGGSSELQERLRAATPSAPASAPLPLGGTPTSDTAAAKAPAAGTRAPDSGARAPQR